MLMGLRQRWRDGVVGEADADRLSDLGVILTAVALALDQAFTTARFSLIVDD